MKFDIPINFSVEAPNEGMAEDLVYNQLKRMITRYGLEDILAFQYFEFIAEEPHSGRRRNDNCCEGKPVQPY